MSIKRLKNQVVMIEREVNRMRQNRSAGTLTNVTTRGITRRPLIGISETSPTTNNNVARWA